MEFQGDFGIFVDGGLSTSNLSTGFSGCAEWGFSDMGTKELIDSAVKGIKNKWTVYITPEEYRTLLKEMHENDCSIVLEYKEWGEKVHASLSVKGCGKGYRFSYFSDWEDIEVPDDVREKVLDSFLELAGDKATREQMEEFLDRTDRWYVKMLDWESAGELLTGSADDFDAGFYWDYDCCSQSINENVYEPSIGLFRSFYKEFHPETEAWKAFVRGVVDDGGDNIEKD